MTKRLMEVTVDWWVNINSLICRGCFCFKSVCIRVYWHIFGATCDPNGRHLSSVKKIWIIYISVTVFLALLNTFGFRYTIFKFNLNSRLCLLTILWGILNLWVNLCLSCLHDCESIDGNMKVTNKMQLYRLIYWAMFHPSSGPLDCIYSIW
jgi:hypothetical protein